MTLPVRLIGISHTYCLKPASLCTNCRRSGQKWQIWKPRLPPTSGLLHTERNTNGWRSSSNYGLNRGLCRSWSVPNNPLLTEVAVNSRDRWPFRSQNFKMPRSTILAILLRCRSREKILSHRKLMMAFILTTRIFINDWGAQFEYKANKV